MLLKDVLLKYVLLKCVFYFQLKTHYFSNTLTSVVRPLIFINFDSVTTSHNEIYKEKFYH